MKLWRLDVMGSVLIKDPSAAGGVVEAKLISGIDDHSRYSVIGKVVLRATARAVCTAFIAALVEYGVPEEVPSDIQRQPAVTQSISARDCNFASRAGKATSDGGGPRGAASSLYRWRGGQ